MPQMKNSTSSVSGVKNSTSSVSGDASSNEHGGEIHSDGAGISSLFVNCRVVLLSLLVLAFGLWGGFLLKQKSETELLLLIKTLENDLSSERTKSQLLKQSVLTLESDLGHEKTKSHGLEDKIEKLKHDQSTQITCVNTVMYAIEVVFKSNPELSDDNDELSHNLLGSTERLELLKSHVKKITEYVPFFFLYEEFPIYDGNDAILYVLKEVFGLSDSAFKKKDSAYKIENHLEPLEYVLCVSFDDTTTCNYRGVLQYHIGARVFQLEKNNMEKIEEFVKNTACKELI